MSTSKAAAREERVQAALADAPSSARKSLGRAFSGVASPRQAIKAACLTCTGFDRSSIQKCTAWACPLWRYRPFQDGPPEKERPEALGKAHTGQGKTEHEHGQSSPSAAMRKGGEA